MMYYNVPENILLTPATLGFATWFTITAVRMHLLELKACKGRSKIIHYVTYTMVQII